jgi:hypothetical protein
MEAARTSETSVNIQLRTQQYIPEDSELNSLSPLQASLDFIKIKNVFYGKHHATES